MAVAVIGGLITSTFLSLLVIPAVFTGVDDLGLKFGKLWRRVTGGSANTPEARWRPELRGKPGGLQAFDSCSSRDNGLRL